MKRFSVAWIVLGCVLIAGIGLYHNLLIGSRRLLTDSELNNLRGTQTTLWCRPHFYCDYPDGPYCDGGTQFCQGVPPNYPCITNPRYYYHPECCDPNLGNDYCSSTPDWRNLLCYIEKQCVCEMVGDELKCRKEVTKEIRCQACSSSLGCAQYACPL
jgi:hypothetical protein